MGVTVLDRTCNVIDTNVMQMISGDSNPDANFILSYKVTFKMFSIYIQYSECHNLLTSHMSVMIFSSMS